VFENRVLKILGLKREKLTGYWSTLQNEELLNLYSSSSITRMIQVTEDEMGKACSMNGEKRNAYRILVGKPERKRPLGRPRHRRVDNIKMDTREIGWGGMDWIDLAQDRDQWKALVNTVANLRVP
jgi:hypothetical protein